MLHQNLNSPWLLTDHDSCGKWGPPCKYLFTARKWDHTQTVVIMALQKQILKMGNVNEDAEGLWSSNDGATNALMMNPALSKFKR